MIYVYILIIIYTFLVIHFSSYIKKIINYELLIFTISCNRIKYLNSSLYSIIGHLNIYENNIEYTFINIDQGTPNRDYIFHFYNMYNIIYLNPCGYSYSFSIAFSLLYRKYVLFLEEDWVVRKNIEKKLFHSNFIYISMKLLSNTKRIYGLYLRHHPQGKDIQRYERSINITYYEVYKPWKGFCYTNGVSIYRSKNLKIMNYGISEYHTARRCIDLNYQIGYIKWEFKAAKKSVKYVFQHIGINSSRIGLCKYTLY